MAFVGAAPAGEQSEVELREAEPANGGGGQSGQSWRRDAEEIHVAREPANQASAAWRRGPANQASAAWRRDPANQASAAWRRDPANQASAAWRREPANQASAAWRRDPANQATHEWRLCRRSLASSNPKRSPLTDGAIGQSSRREAELLDGVGKHEPMSGNAVGRRAAEAEPISGRGPSWRREAKAEPLNQPAAGW
ncbi:hypothetical protein EV421DRAFT_1903761 [Armillaria borealis]|uniref:Uncharacterized protein n=1 Tax=Armillaria borealis TaxID=47425 RepID=A0AA39JMS0_9AGAR|nr:hypothetical protein EV421DRAFT_1903761 [Armillaria borealis]